MGKTSRRKAASSLKEPAKTKRTKKTKGNPADEINMLASTGLTKDIFARLGKERVEKRYVKVYRDDSRKRQSCIKRKKGSGNW